MPPQKLTPRAPQGGLQSLFLLVPAGFFGLRSLLDSLDLGLDGGGPLRVLLLGLVQRSLRLVDGLLPAFTALLPGGLFARPFKLAAPPFPFVVESGLPFRNLIDGARGRLLRLWAFRLAGSFRGSAAAEIGGKLGMFFERSVGPDRAPEYDARLCHGRSDDVRIIAFLRRALMKEIAVCAPRFERRFHGGSGYRQIEESERRLVGFQFSGHRPDQTFPFDSQRRAPWDLPRRLTEHAMALSVPSFLKDVHALRNKL